MASFCGSLSKVDAIRVSRSVSSGVPMRVAASSSRISGLSLAVSAARAAATMTAVDPTLVAMSHESSSVRVVITSSSSAFGGHERRKRVVVGGLQRDVAPEPALHVLRWLRVRVPAVAVEPLCDVGALGVVVGQILHVDGLWDAELVGDPLESLPHRVSPLGRVAADGFYGYPAAVCTERGDLLEKPVLGVGRQIHQQAFGQPCGR